MTKDTDDRAEDLAGCYLPIVTVNVEVGVNDFDHVLDDAGDGTHHVDEGHHDQHLVQLGLR